VFGTPLCTVQTHQNKNKPMTREQYAKKFAPQAIAAGKRYNLNPVVILAQGMHESGYGTSYGALVRKNHFGITAAGKPNEFWDGSKSPSKTNPHLIFRIYKTDQDSFYDFARLISSKYTTAAAVSNDTTSYAKAIAYSPYISEANGDNREQYQRAIVVNSNFVNSLSLFSANSEDLKKKI
jgi:flagellar protein FlgJ